MVKASEEERSLMERPLSPGKTKATAILSWCLYGQCSGSSRNKCSQGTFGHVLSLATELVYA